MTDPKMFDSFKTIKLNNINTKKRLSFKTFQYKKRLHYGYLESIGFLSTELRLQPLLDNTEITYIRPDPQNIDDNILNKLNYIPELLIPQRESKRETKLRKMLLDKIIKLSQMKK